MNTNTKSHLLGILLLVLYAFIVITWSGTPLVDMVMYCAAGWFIGGAIRDFSQWVFKQ